MLATLVNRIHGLIELPEYRKIGGIVTEMQWHAPAQIGGVDILPLLKFFIDDHCLKSTLNLLPWATTNEKLVEKLVSREDVRRLVSRGAIMSMVLFCVNSFTDDGDTSAEITRLLRIRLRFSQRLITSQWLLVLA